MTDFWQLEKYKNPQPRINTGFFEMPTMREINVLRRVYTLKR